MLEQDPFYIQLKQTLQSRLEKDQPRFHAYSVTIRKSRSLQNLLIGDDETGIQSYQDRDVDELSYSMTVYSRHGEQNENMGQFYMSLDPMTPLEEQIQMAFEGSLMVCNPPWTLAKPPEKGYMNVINHDPTIMENQEAVRTRLLSEIASCARNLKEVKLNSAELYVNLSESLTQTSGGLTLPEASTDIYFEAAMEQSKGVFAHDIHAKKAANEGKLNFNTQEVHRYFKGVTVAEMDVPGYFHLMEEETLSLGATLLPMTSQNATLIVDEEVIASFLNAIQDQLSADAEYNRFPHLLPENAIARSSDGGKVDGDLLNLTLDPLIPSMVKSTPFTSEGLAAQKADVIVNGIVKHQIIGNRMGQYLKKEPNGIAGNHLVPAGNYTKSELIAMEPECIEILSFSSLLINPRTLTWSSEIKLGRLYRDGKAVALLKGGVASGDIREHLLSMRFSSNIVTRNAPADSWHSAVGYKGPDAMLIRRGARIAGGH